MGNDQFIVHAMVSPYDPRTPGLNVEHVFISSSKGNDWNCFGRGTTSTDPSREIATVTGFADWAQLVYGGKTSEGRQDGTPAALLMDRIDGVCHNVANRILVLAGDYDVRAALGDELAILMYGKYGFGIAAFIEAIKKSALQLKGSVSDQDVADVLSRVTRDISPDNELALLRADMEAHFAKHFPDFSDTQRSSFDRIYDNFQQSRQQTFDAALRSGDRTDFQRKYVTQMAPALLQCLRDIQDALGQEQYLKIFVEPPEAAVRFLLPAIS